MSNAITDPVQVGGHSVYAGKPYAENDGLPDKWEAAHGLNPKGVADAALDRNKAATPTLKSNWTA